jgi:hypothetical protein
MYPLDEIRARLRDDDYGFYVLRGHFSEADIDAYRDESAHEMRTGKVIYERINADGMFDYVHPRSFDDEERTIRLYRFMHNHRDDATDRMFSPLIRLRDEVESAWLGDPVYREEKRVQQEFIQVTRYIDDFGELPRHRDYNGPARYPLIQIWGLLSRPETDYHGGNLAIYSRSGKRYRVEGDLGVGPGDILFFDKSLDHEVESVRGGKEPHSAGRWTVVGARSERLTPWQAKVRRWKFDGRIFPLRRRVKRMFRRKAA